MISGVKAAHERNDASKALVDASDISRSMEERSRRGRHAQVEYAVCSCGPECAKTESWRQSLDTRQLTYGTQL